MSFLKVVGKGGATKPDESLLAAQKFLTDGIADGSIKSVLILTEGPTAREYYAAGNFDLDTMCGLSHRAFLALSTDES